MIIIDVPGCCHQIVDGFLHMGVIRQTVQGILRTVETVLAAVGLRLLIPSVKDILETVSP